MRSDLSKYIGWDPPKNMRYPQNFNEIESANDTQIAIWIRFLPSPINDLQYNMLNRILEISNERGIQAYGSK